MSLISTVGGIQNAISRRLNEVSADNADRYLDYINEGMRDIASMFPRAPWLQTSAVLTLAASNLRWQLSSIATNVRHIYGVAISAENVKLVGMKKEQFDTLDPQPDDMGIPRIFTVFNDEIYFFPQPNSNYGAQVMYLKDIDSVSTSSAVPEIPSRYFEGLVQYGWIQGLYLREDYDLAAQIEAKYEVYKQQMKKEMKKIIQQSSRMFSVREFQSANSIYNDEITQSIWGNN